MILEYADGGTLFEKVRNENLNKKQIKKYFKDVCEAVAYMHSNDIMHRDIKVISFIMKAIKYTFNPERAGKVM